jgi:hypothetical protein
MEGECKVLSNINLIVQPLFFAQYWLHDRPVLTKITTRSPADQGIKIHMFANVLSPHSPHPSTWRIITTMKIALRFLQHPLLLAPNARGLSVSSEGAPDLQTPTVSLVGLPNMAFSESRSYSVRAQCAEQHRGSLPDPPLPAAVGPLAAPATKQLGPDDANAGASTPLCMYVLFVHCFGRNVTFNGGLRSVYTNSSWIFRRRL